MNRARRLTFLLILAMMPEEAFLWVAVAVATRIFPDGLGGFRPDSRQAIEAIRSEAEMLTKGE